jgi:hypothetical protein
MYAYFFWVSSQAYHHFCPSICKSRSILDMEKPFQHSRCPRGTKTPLDPRRTVVHGALNSSHGHSAQIGSQFFQSAEQLSMRCAQNREPQWPRGLDLDSSVSTSATVSGSDFCTIATRQIRGLSHSSHMMPRQGLKTAQCFNINAEHKFFSFAYALLCEYRPDDFDIVTLYRRQHDDQITNSALQREACESQLPSSRGKSCFC